MATSRSYHTDLIESLKDPQEAAAYLDAVLEDGTIEELHLALKNVAEAHLVVASEGQLALNSGMPRQFSIQPSALEVSTLLNMLDALGLRLSVTPKVS